MKMMELITHLSVKKPGSSSYIQNGESNRIAIHRDVEILVKDEGIPHKGIAKVTFLGEISRVSLVAHNSD